MINGYFQGRAESAPPHSSYIQKPRAISVKDCFLVISYFHSYKFLWPTLLTKHLFEAVKIALNRQFKMMFVQFSGCEENQARWVYNTV